MFENTPRYLDPLSDFGFKKLLTTDANKDLLIAFLNEVLDGEQHIEDVVYNQNEWRGSSAKKKRIILDVLCTDENGGKFLIEMQRIPQPNFKSRALYYASTLIAEQLEQGGNKDDQYALLPLHFIAIMEFKIEEMEQNCIDHIFLCSTSTGRIFDRSLRFTYISLPNFKKDDTELLNNLDSWLYLFKHLSTLKTKPKNISDPIFNKLFKIAEYSQLNEEEKSMYDQELKIERDILNVQWGWRMEGKLEGRLEGKLEVKLEIAVKLFDKKLPIKEISEITGIEESKLLELLNREECHNTETK